MNESGESEVISNLASSDLVTTDATHLHTIPASASPAELPRNSKLVKCPECDADVSPRARACPKCGGPLGYPDFYIKVSEYGLNLKNLIWDYEARFEHNGGCLTADSPFGSVLTHDEEAVADTRAQILVIYDEIDKRRTQISSKSQEFDELLLFKCYLGKLLGVCNPRNREESSMRIIIRDLERCRDGCQIEGNAKCVQEAMDACKEFLATCR